jgi:hypothetical protein
LERDKTWRTMMLIGIDDLLIECAHRYARSTVADIAGSIRAFTQFLPATGRISVELEHVPAIRAHSLHA